MKKVIISSIVTLIIGFVCGISVSNHKSGKSSNKFKTELIEAQAKALDDAATLIDKHNLFDADSSDLMDDYVFNYNVVDSLYKTQL